MAFFTFTSDPAKYAGVPQKTFAITNAGSERNILFTNNVKTCFVVTFYDKENKTGALLHIDNLTLFAESFKKIRKNFERNKTNCDQLEIKLIGGYQTSKKAYSNILNELTQFTTSPIEETVFKKRELSNKELSKLRRSYRKYQIYKDDKKKQAADKINQIVANESYSQITLDTQTGDVSITSQFEYLLPLEEQKKCKAYSEKAFKMINLIETIADSDVTKIENIKEFNLKHTLALTKVFDGISREKSYYQS